MGRSALIVTRELYPGDEFQANLPRRRLGFGDAFHRIVIGQSDRTEPDLRGRLNYCRRGQSAVGPIGMQVQVNSPANFCGSVEPVFCSDHRALHNVGLWRASKTRPRAV